MLQVVIHWENSSLVSLVFNRHVVAWKMVFKVNSGPACEDGRLTGNVFISGSDAVTDSFRRLRILKSNRQSQAVGQNERKTYDMVETFFPLGSHDALVEHVAATGIAEPLNLVHYDSVDVGE